MLWIVMFFVTIVGGFVQAAVPPLMLFGHAKPAILLAVVLYYALNHDAGSASVSAMLAGALNDFLSMSPIGETSIVFFVIALLAGCFRRLVHGEEIFTASLFGGVSAFFAVFASYHLLAREGLVILSTGALWARAAGSLFLGALVSPFVFMVIRGIDSFTGNVFVREVVEDVLD